MTASLAGACLRPLGHLSGTRLIQGKPAEAQGLCGFDGGKLWGEQMFWLLRLMFLGVRERVTNVGTNLAQAWTLFVPIVGAHQ